jgi:exonuclease-1
VDFYVGYAMQRVDMMLTLGVTPVLIFDGASLPAKQHESYKRRLAKQAAQDKAKALLKRGQREEARIVSRTGIDVTFQMRQKMIQACRECNIGECPKAVAVTPAERRL